MESQLQNYIKENANKGVLKKQLDKNEFENDDFLHFHSNIMRDYSLKQSSSSFNLEDIENFLYGPFTSRFWMLRKHILQLDQIEFQKDPAFYGWNCITLQIKNKWDVNLIFNSEHSLQQFIKLLIHHMNSLDGQCGSSLKLQHQLIEQEVKQRSQ